MVVPSLFRIMTALVGDSGAGVVEGLGVPVLLFGYEARLEISAMRYSLWVLLFGGSK